MSWLVALSQQQVEQTMIFYLCPRPVFLVSVSDGDNSRQAILATMDNLRRRSRHTPRIQ
jgi:hypothetical protein